VAIANANVPNMLGQISTTMAHAGLNIHNMVNKSRGEMAYTLVDVDSPLAPGTAGRQAPVPAGRSRARR
jgi:D-3-phosphoglycerate dehydrogenase